MIVAVTDLFEIPKTCGDCPFFIAEYSDYGSCPLTDEGMDSDDLKIRSGGCPLKEVPDNAIH